jgi:hypothetical protein
MAYLGLWIVAASQMIIDYDGLRSNFHRRPVFGPKMRHEITTLKRTTEANHEGNAQKLNAKMLKDSCPPRPAMKQHADSNMKIAT